MKKYLMSLAALMITLSATVLTSCNPKNEPENVVTPGEITPEPGTHVETLTIAFPEQTQTRVAIDGSYNLTGWELGDEVTLVRTSFEVTYSEFGAEGPVEYIFNVERIYTFSCTNAANGTFTGTIDDGWSVNDCQLAFYNAKDFTTNGRSEFYFSPKSRASQNMKDVVMLVAKNDGEGNFEMEIFGSILQVTNNTGADITASVKYSWAGYGRYYDCSQIDCYDSGFDVFGTNIGANLNHQITLSKDAPTYVYIPVLNLNGGNAQYAVGLSAAGDAANECSIVPFKTNPANAKLFKKTLTPATTGAASVLESAGCPNNECGWVQLWENGPKWAVFNVGVTDGNAESYGSRYAWGGAQADVDDHNTGSGSFTLSSGSDTSTRLWGSSWRTPTRAEYEALLTNCDVEWVTINGVNGRKYTGKNTYSTNHVFFPVATYNYGAPIYEGNAYYWTSVSDGSDFAYTFNFGSNHQYVYYGDRYPRSCLLSVRAVRAE